jgi:hypothetical protein
MRRPLGSASSPRSSSARCYHEGRQASGQATRNRSNDDALDSSRLPRVTAGDATVPATRSATSLGGSHARIVPCGTRDSYPPPVSHRIWAHQTKKQEKKDHSHDRLPGPPRASGTAASMAP